MRVRRPDRCHRARRGRRVTKPCSDHVDVNAKRERASGHEGRRDRGLAGSGWAVQMDERCDSRIMSEPPEPLPGTATHQRLWLRATRTDRTTNSPVVPPLSGAADRRSLSGSPAGRSGQDSWRADRCGSVAGHRHTGAAVLMIVGPKAGLRFVRARRSCEYRHRGRRAPGRVPLPSPGSAPTIRRSRRVGRERRDLLLMWRWRQTPP